MTTQFPSALDNFTNPTPSDNLNTPAVLHSDQHSNENDAIEAIEAWVGISGSLNPPTHEYRLRQLEGNSSGTSRLVGWNKGVGVGTGTIFNVTETDLTLSRSGTVLELSRTTGTTFYLGVNGSRVWAYRASGTWLIITNTPDPLDDFWTSGSGGDHSVVQRFSGAGATGSYAVAVNYGFAGGEGSFAEGFGYVGGYAAHAEGNSSAYGDYSHAEGYNNNVFSPNSSVGGINSVVTGSSSFAHGNSAVVDGVDSAILGGQSSYLRANRSVLLGGIGLTGTANDTVYVPRLNIRNVLSNSPVTNIGVDSNGNVVSGTSSSVVFPQELIGIYGKDEGQNVGTGTILNVVGDNVSLSLSGTTLTLSHTNPAFPQELIGIYGKDEGQNVGTGTILNVVGDDVSLSLSGTTLTLTHANPTIAFPQELIGIYGTDEGIPVGTGTVLDVVGENLSLSRSGTVLTLSHTNPSINFPQEVIGIMGQDEGVPLGTGSTLNVVGNNIALSISGTVLQLTHIDTPVTFPQELIGLYGQNKAVNLGTGTTLNVNGSRLVMTLSGTVFDLSNSPDPQEIIGLVGMNKSSSLGTGTTLNVSGTRIQLSKNGDVLELTNSPDPQELIGIYGLSNGVPLGTGTWMDFGNNLTASLSGSVLRVDAAAGGQFAGVDQIGMYGHDEGVPVGTGTILNVTGERAVLSLSGTVLNLNISPDPEELIGVAIQNEGSFLATGVTIDIMGSVTISGSVVNLRVPKTIAFTNSATAGGVVFTNLAINDTTYLGVVADLTGYTQCKLGGVFGAAATATASGAIIHIMWATGSSYANLAELAKNPATEQGRLRWITSTQRATDWFDINPGAAYRDVGLHLRITGGNGTADPNLLGLCAEFR